MEMVKTENDQTEDDEADEERECFMIIVCLLLSLSLLINGWWSWISTNPNSCQWLWRRDRYGVIPSIILPHQTSLHIAPWWYYRRLWSSSALDCYENYIKLRLTSYIFWIPLFRILHNFSRFSNLQHSDLDFIPLADIAQIDIDGAWRNLHYTCNIISPYLLDHYKWTCGMSE